MATTDDNDNQGSSTGAEITADDIGNENSPCTAENSIAEDTVAMATSEPNSSPSLKLTSSRSGSPVPVLDSIIEDDTNSQSSQSNENHCIASIQSGDEKDALVSEDNRVTVQSLTEENESAVVSETNFSQNSQCEVNERSIDEKVEDDKKTDEEEEEEDGSDLKTSSAEDTEMISPQDQTEEQTLAARDDNNESENKCNESIKETEGTVDEAQVEYVVKVTEVSDESMSSAHDLMITDPDAVIPSEDDDKEPSKQDNPSRTSTPQFTSTILNSEDSCDQNSQESFTQSNRNESVKEQHMDQNSQSSLAEEPPLLIASDTECFIRLDEETFKEWNETRSKMGFGNDSEMARFLMKRLATQGLSETQSNVQDAIQMKSKSQTRPPADVQKKKATSFGGLESIVRRLQQTRTDTPATSQPGSDTENTVGSELSKIKTEPEEMCNTDASIPKKATTSIYSSGRNGRKRVFVKREKDIDMWAENQQESSQFGGYGQDDYQSSMTSNEQNWPVHNVRIKQEPIDPSEMSAQNEAGEKASTLGQFVRSAASWVSHLVASELEKPQEADAPPAPAAAETPESLFSDSRLHKIIEAQLSKSNEPSLSEKRLHSVIEEQLKKPVPQMGATHIKTENNPLLAQSKAVKKEMKKARREARHAKKLKKAQKKERERELQRYGQQAGSPFERPLSDVSSSSPFEKTVSPFMKSASPFDKSYSPLSSSGPEPTSASHCLESFARMVQIREFKSGGSPGNQTPPRVQNPAQVVPVPIQPQIPTTAGKQPVPVPTGLHNPIQAATGNQPIPIGLHSNANVPSNPGVTAGFSPQPQSISPAPNASSTDSAEHPASLALKSIARRSFTQEEGESGGSAALPHQDLATAWENQIEKSKSPDPPTETPLTHLLKVSENPQQNSAKSQLENLLKAKDIKDQWAKPSPHLAQQVPHHVAQAHLNYSPHILNVPKVTFSGRTVNDRSHDSFIKAPVIDRILASTGVSSDSEDSDAREAKDLTKDPDWCPEKKKRAPRKRVFPNNLSESGFSPTTSQSPERVMAVAGEPLSKQQKLDNSAAVQSANPSPLTNGGGNKNTELSATNTLAKLLQMATKNNQENSAQSPMKTSQSTPQKNTTKVSNVSTPKSDYSATPKSDYSAKQSAFGAMQAFAQLVEIQGKTPTKPAQKPPAQSSPPAQPPPPPGKLSDSLPSITPPDGYQNSPASQVQTDQNGASYENNYGYSSARVNGGHSHDLDEPEDLSMHSNIKIKIEPLDRDDSNDSVRQTETHDVDLLGKQHMQFTCSLCSRVFPSMTEVTDHKLRIHYSSSFESFEMVS